MTVIQGYLSHVNPLTFDPNNPTLDTNGFALFLTQVIIIIVLCQILGKSFQAIGQPAVVGEILAGVLLGPTCFSNISGFTDTIVPPYALGLLKLMAQLGVSLFLFLVGLETDTHLMTKYYKNVLIITLPGMAIPFAIAVGISRLIWKLETDQSVEFTAFFLFVGTVMAVTSLSVLSRILAEMGILSTVLGAITIAVGACNDLIGYTLMVLGIALGSGGNKIDAVYELLAVAGYILALWFIFRPIVNRLIDASGFDMAPDSQDNVPQHLLVITVLGSLISAFYTDAIGVHPIFGAFAFGVCCPHGNFAIKVTKSIETLVMVVLLPLYFATIGLSTDFKLLDSGKTWGLVFLLVIGIFISKFSATTVSAKLAGMSWRESMFIASLMQSKGIIEIIILNVALDIKAVSPRVFSILVICCICTTISVRPLSKLVYYTSAANSEPSIDKSDSSVTTVLSALPTDEKRNDQGGSTSSNLDTSSSDLVITVGIVSPNPAVQALMSLVNLLSQGSAHAQQQQDRPDHGQIALDLLRLLPIEYTRSTIMQLVNFSNDGPKDLMMECLKRVQSLHGVPTSAHLAVERSVFHETNYLSVQSQTLGQQPHAELPPDMFTVPKEEMIKMMAKHNTKAQTRLGIPQNTRARDSDSGLGGGLVIVAWETSNSLGRSMSWLGAAAEASGLSALTGDQDRETAAHFWQTHLDVRVLPHQLFKELRHQCSTAVLIDQALFASRKKKRTRPLSTVHREALEEKLGIQRPPHQRRLFVPFFGGADDRGAVELMRKLVLASEGTIDGVVLSLHNENNLQHLPEKSNDIIAATSRRSSQETTNTEEEERIAEEHHASINLQTIHRAEAARADARFLFGQHHGPSTSGGGVAGSSSSNNDEIHPSITPFSDLPRPSPLPATNQDVQQPVTHNNNGIHFISLSSLSETTLPSNLNSIQTLLHTLLLPLLDSSRDMVIVGRGKLGQRSKEFRAEVQLIHNEDDTWNQDTIRPELEILGTTMGAVTEGLLYAGLDANLLVLQVKKP